MERMIRMKSNTRTLNYVALGLIIVSLALLFVPYWHYGEGETASVNAYVWFPGDCKALESYLSKAVTGSFSINSVVWAPALMMLLGVVAAVVCLIKPDGLFSLIASIPFAALGIFGFAGVEALRLGSLWWLQLIVCVALLATDVGLILSKTGSGASVQ